MNNIRQIEQLTNYWDNKSTEHCDNCCVAKCFKMFVMGGQDYFAYRCNHCQKVIVLKGK